MSQPNTYYRRAAYVATAALVLAVLDVWPYGYYQLLRWGGFVAGWGAWVALDAEQTGWAVGLGALAILFNPIAPISFGRGAWAVIDIASATTLITSTRRIEPATQVSEKHP